MALTVGKATLDAAVAAHIAGDLSRAYSILAEAGNNYAEYASRIVDGTPDSFERQIKAMWEYAAPGSVAAAWTDVAEQHQSQYLQLILEGRNQYGTYDLPTTFEIEQSYARALADNNQPLSLSVDLVLNTLIDSAFGPFGKEPENLKWELLLGIEQERSSGIRTVVPGMSDLSAAKYLVAGEFFNAVGLFAVIMKDRAVDIRTSYKSAVQNWLNGMSEAAFDSIMSTANPQQCFTAGTKVTMADNTVRKISDVSVGDIIMSFDVEGALIPARITQLLSSTTDTWLHLSNGTYVTPGHRYLRPDGTFAEIQDIIATEGRIVAADGSIQTVTAEVIRYSAETAHLFEEAEMLVYASEGGAALAPQVKRGWKTYNFTVA